MRAIKKINNNVALCEDNNQNELIAFGKGIGFPKMPYEVDLEQITMTFYQVDVHYYDLIGKIPEEIFELASYLVTQAMTSLTGEFNPNLVFNLADHIHFAITRQQAYQKIKLPFSFEIEQFYPKETALGRLALQLIKTNLHIVLPESEVTGIAWHFINARNESEQPDQEQQTETFILAIIAVVKNELSIVIDENSINYNRFVLHLRYYLKRLRDDTQSTHESATFLENMRKEYPAVYDCAIHVGQMVEEKYGVKTTDEEILYLMLHINRIYQNSLLQQ